MSVETSNNASDNLSSYKDRISNLSSDFEFGVFLNLIRKSVLLLLFIAALIGTGAFLLIRYSQPIYESRGVIQINVTDQAKELLNVFSPVNESDGLNPQVELLRSPLLNKMALENMNIEVGYFTKGQILENNKYNSNSFRIKNYSLLDSTLIGRKFFIAHKGDNQFQLVNEGGDVFENQIFSEGEKVMYKGFSFEFQVISKAQFQTESKDDRVYFRFQTADFLFKEIKEGIDINILNAGAKTVEIKLKHVNPVFAADFVNELISQYDDYVVNRKNVSSENILQFIQEQKDSVESRLKDSEKMIQLFQKDNDLKGTTGLSSSYLTQLISMEEEIVKLEIEGAVLSQVNSSISGFDVNTNPEDIIPLIVGHSFESSLQVFILKLQTLTNDRIELLNSATLDNKNVKQLEKQIKMQITLILKSSDITLKQNNEKIKTLKSKIQLLEGQLFSLPEKELELTRLNRILNINNKYYTMLLEKETEYRLSTAGVTTYNEILDPAQISRKPISPNRKIIYAVGIILFLMLALFIIIIKYITHDKITTLNEISKISNASLGILGIVPKYKSEMPVSQMIIGENPKSLISESFRSLRTNLEFIVNQKGPQTLAVTSTISGEGKTFVALNLGGIIAYSGKKVIILDLDMRKPKIHRGFNVDNLRGMSTLLIGKDKIEDCVNHSKLDNFDFITAGPIPPNPSELIINGEIFNIIDELKKTYDMIIIDNPPVGLVTDGIPIIKYVDFPLYIFRSDYSRKNFVQNADRLVNENGITKLTAVLNGVDSQRKNYGSYYGYGYGYGYGSSGYGGYYAQDEQVNAKWYQLGRFFKKK